MEIQVAERELLKKRDQAKARGIARLNQSLMAELKSMARNDTREGTIIELYRLAQKEIK